MVLYLPVLGAPYEEHLKDHGGVLPYVFLADVRRFAISALSDGQDVKALLVFLENAFNSGDSNIRNLIAVAFLEGLMSPGDEGAVVIRAMLGPTLKGELRAMEDWKPPEFNDSQQQNS
jgi:hypothetical protein